MTDNKAAPLH